MKKVYIFIILILLIGVGVFFIIPKTEVWNKTVRCYNFKSLDVSLPDDTKLEDIMDYIDAECDFEIQSSAIMKRVTGTVKLGDTVFQISSDNAKTVGVNFTEAKVYLNGKWQMSDHVWLSKDNNYICITTDLVPSSEYSSWYGPCATLKELKECMEAFT